MSIGGISGSRYESMRAQFESFRSGSSKLQKSDLEDLKTALTTEGVTDEKSTSGIDELISKFSEIDTNGDGISTDELDTAAQSGAITMKGPQGGPPPGGMKGPPPGPPPGGMGGGPGGATGSEDEQQGVAQSDLMGYDLFEEFKKKLQEQSDLTAQNTDSTDASTSTEETLIDLLSQLNKSSESASEDSSDSSSSESNAQSLAKMLNQQIMAAYGRNSSPQQFDVSSLLGDGITV